MLTINELLKCPVQGNNPYKLNHNGVTFIKSDNGSNRMKSTNEITVMGDGTLVSTNKLQVVLRHNSGGLVTSGGRLTPSKPSTDNPTSTIKVNQKSNKYKVNKSEVRSRIVQRINSQMNNKKMYLFTVSFPPIVSDSNAFRYLNIWLTQLRQTGLLKSYLWVAERQKVGTMHYHLAIPHYLNVSKANKFMCTTLVNEVRKGKLQWNLNAAKRYNGVDVCKNLKSRRITNFAEKGKSKSLSIYLSKYVSKNNEEFVHKAWGCSKDYSQLKCSIRITKNELLELGIHHHLDYSKRFDNDYICFIPFKNAAPWIVTKIFEVINGLVQYVYDNKVSCFNVSISKICSIKLNDLAKDFSNLLIESKANSIRLAREIYTF